MLLVEKVTRRAARRGRMVEKEITGLADREIAAKMEEKMERWR